METILSTFLKDYIKELDMKTDYPLDKALQKIDMIGAKKSETNTGPYNNEYSAENQSDELKNIFYPPQHTELLKNKFKMILKEKDKNEKQFKNVLKKNKELEKHRINLLKENTKIKEAFINLESQWVKDKSILNEKIVLFKNEIIKTRKKNKFNCNETSKIQQEIKILLKENFEANKRTKDALLKKADIERQYHEVTQLNESLNIQLNSRKAFYFTVTKISIIISFITLLLIMGYYIFFSNIPIKQTYHKLIDPLNNSFDKTINKTIDPKQIKHKSNDIDIYQSEEERAELLFNYILGENRP